MNQSFFKNIITRWLGVMGFLIAVSFFLQTQDSAYVKIVIFQAGSFGLGALWLISLICRKTNIFTKRNFIVLLPFILYAAYGVCSFFFQPYMAVRAESFFRFLLYSLVFTVTLFELDEESFFKICGYILAACWVVLGYGIFQTVNNYIMPGIDPLFWTDFFGKRVFSTIANPNFFANFCLFSVILAFARFLQTKQKSLIVLVIIGIVNIFFTESKGAWLALAASIVLFAALYLNYFVDIYKKHRVIFNASAVILILLTFALVGNFASKRMQSVNFRLSTWRATWDMIEAKPIVGTGIGSFSTIYSAYKRPEIFYMENLHNAETQHAENYYLEQWATLGTMGFGLFLLAFFYMARGVLRKLKYFNKKTASGSGHNKIYMILGYSMASAAVYIHNFVDVSIYFVSTGFFLAYFNGAVVNLVCGPMEKREKDFEPTPGGWVYLGIAFIACIFIAILAVFVTEGFVEISTGMSVKYFLLFVISWLLFLVTIFSVLLTFWFVIFKTKRISTAIILAVASFLMFTCFGFLKADYYISIAGRLATDLNPVAAQYYTKALKLSPFRSSIYQFKAMVFSNRLDLSKTYKPAEGDTGERLYNDYDRSLENFKMAQRLSPNDVLLFYNMGNLYRNMALKLSKTTSHVALASQKAEIAEMYALSSHNYQRALLTDPVFDNIYYQLANISLDHNDLRAAYMWLTRYIKGPKDVVNLEYLQRNRANEKANMHLKNIEALIPPAEKRNLDAYSL